MTTAEVDTWFGDYEHPQKEAMLRVREIILSVDERMDECIKWKSPTFTFKGNLASFNPKTKKHVSLMFHTGKKIPGFENMDGSGETAGYMKFQDMDDVEKRKGDLVAITKAWIELKS